ncbi:MAG: AMP-binding protein, partial [Psychrosphaera sp.]|nr:AMP-binding protein [Psychrosphaera sp.]
GESAEGLSFGFEYNTDLFDANTIKTLGRHFVTLLEGIVANPSCRIGQLPMMSQAERQVALSTVNQGRRVYPKTHCIHQLFEQQVELRPEAIALRYLKEQLSYQQLNEKANQLAHHLQAQGIKPDTLVGLSVDRSPEMVIGILAILKAGGAYVPLDPNYPQSRLDYIVKDSGIKVLLSEKDINAASEYPVANPKVTLSPDNLAYVIYTSGTTGQPKGVMVEHHNVVRLLQSTDADFNFNPNDVWTLFHSYAFDFSVWEIWGALAYGGRLVVVPSGMPQAVDDFYQLLVDEKVTILNQTPSAFNQLSAIDAQAQKELSLRTVIFGGEALNLQNLAAWVERHGDNKPQLVNMYGITETTVHVTYRRILAQDLADNKGSLIGRPIGDLSLYIFDS